LGFGKHVVWFGNAFLYHHSALYHLLIWFDQRS
jgi:hypothetical protein